MAKKKSPTDDTRAEKVQMAVRAMLLWFGFLHQYRLTVSFTDTLEEITKRPNAVATVRDNYPYRNIEMMFKRSFVDKADDDQIQEIVLHEIMHVFLFGPIDRYLEKRGLSRDQEYADIEESIVELPTMWLTRLQQEIGPKAWETV